ncbi:ASCH domain-containing protein [Devosia sp. D6-9]|nr:ASCH domain-containing protein [Devosia sp. D6-9]
MALSIRQPWCWAILEAGKDIENRKWWTSRRGPICIHASSGMTRVEYDLATQYVTSIRPQFAPVLKVPAFDALERGGIVGVVDIVDVVTGSASPWFFGQYGFVLANASPVPFIPVKGKQGFFRWRERL